MRISISSPVYLSPRILLGTLLLLILGGPAPGAVGSCEEQERDTDLFTFCREREELTCFRRGLRRELTEDAVNECRLNAIRQCQQRIWAPECKPTARQADACINALRATETVDTPEDQIAECNEKALCKVQLPKIASDDSDGGVRP